MTDTDKIIDQAMADPVVQSALRTLHALRCRENVDALMYECMVAITKYYAATLLSAGQTTDEINEQLPAFVLDIQAQCQRIASDVVRFLDEPQAQSHTLQ